jgi:hypothetical protein
MMNYEIITARDTLVPKWKGRFGRIRRKMVNDIFSRYIEQAWAVEEKDIEHVMKSVEFWTRSNVYLQVTDHQGNSARVQLVPLEPRAEYTIHSIDQFNDPVTETFEVTDGLVTASNLNPLRKESAYDNPAPLEQMIVQFKHNCVIRNAAARYGTDGLERILPQRWPSVR